MKKSLVVVCGIIIVLGLGGIANAISINPIGAPALTGSWTQSWGVISCCGDMDKMEAFIISGNTDFESPGVTNLWPLSWSATLVNPDYLLVTGTPIVIDNGLYWNETYTAAMSEPFMIDHLLWNGSSFIVGWRNNWDGTGWNDGSVIRDPSGYNRSSVPEPSTMLLLGSGLAVIVALRRQFTA